MPDPEWWMTIEEFVATARTRKNLSISSDGCRITDGSRSYPLPRLPGGRMEAWLVGSLCEFFDLQEIDFALDARRDD